MKLSYKKQLTLSIILVILGNIFTTILHHWIYRSIGFWIAGTMWIIHPVIWDLELSTKRNLMYVRISGIIIVLIGLFTRVGA